MPTYLAVVDKVDEALNMLYFSYIKGAQDIVTGLQPFKNLQLQKGECIHITTNRPNVGGRITKIVRDTE
jgi:hypothetical protein